MNIDIDAALNVASQIVISAGLLAIVIKGALQYVFAKELEKFKNHLGLVQKLRADEQTQMLQKQREAVLALWNSVHEVIGAAEAVNADIPSANYAEVEANLISSVKEAVLRARKDVIYYPSAFDSALIPLREIEIYSDAVAILHSFKKLESVLSAMIRKLYLEDLNNVMMKQ